MQTYIENGHRLYLFISKIDKEARFVTQQQNGLNVYLLRKMFNKALVWNTSLLHFGCRVLHCARKEEINTLRFFFDFSSIRFGLNAFAAIFVLQRFVHLCLCCSVCIFFTSFLLSRRISACFRSTYLYFATRNFSTTTTQRNTKTRIERWQWWWWLCWLWRVCVVVVVVAKVD